MSAELDAAMEQYNLRKARELLDINQQMIAAEAETMPTIPEDVFVNVFLPFFANIGNPYGVTIDTWLGRVARSETNSVGVLDKNGLELYRVPPMYDISVLVANRDKPSMYNDVMLANQIAAISPVDAENHITNALMDKMDFRDVGATGANNISSWVDIFKRYNLVTNLPSEYEETNKGAEPTVTAGGKTVKPKEDLIVDGYEEF
jgi:hypothetical protein